MNRHRVNLLCLAGLATAIAAAPTRADVKTAAYQSDSQFLYEIIHVPDFDQVRAFGGFTTALPNDGKAYCVPTATMNLMAYIANHGFPQVAPGAANWQSNSLYETTTQHLSLMGGLMGTHPKDGTNGNGWHFGAWAWLLPHNKFVINMYTANYSYSPTATSLTKTALNGSIVNFAYGRYEKTGTFNGIPILSRDGGHCVALAKSAKSGASQVIFCRDPASPNDGNWWAQSWFGNRELDVENQLVTTGATFTKVKVMSALNYDSTKEKNAYIDQYLAIRPKSGYAFQSSGPDWVFQYFTPFSFSGHDTPNLLKFALKSEVIDAVIGPDWNSFYAMVTADGALKDLCKVDLLSEDMAKITTIQNAKAMVFGRKRGLYVTTGNQLLLVDELQKNPVQQVTDLPFPCDQICFDDARDQVVLLSVAAGKIVKYPDSAAGQPAEVITIPAGVPLGGKANVVVNPADGQVWFRTDKSNCLFRLGTDAAGNTTAETVCLPGVTNPKSLEFDDAGNLFVAENGRPAEFQYFQDTGEWKPVAGSAWSQYAIGDNFRMLRSRTNHDPSLDEPGPQHVDPDELGELVGDSYIPDCEVDAANEEYGTGKAGTPGVPHLGTTELPYLGVASSIRLDNALPGALPILVLGLQQVALPFDGGTLLASPQFVVPLPVPVKADGTLSISGTVPPDPNLCGLELFHQMLVPDPGASGFYKLALSNGLKRTLGS